MSSVGKYSIHMSPPKFSYQPLWHESSCTLSYTSHLPPLDRAQRFQYNSIYYKDDPFKPAKKIDQFQKPDLLLIEFRRNIREANQVARIKINNRNSSIKNILRERSDHINTQSSLKEKEIVDRLWPKNQKPLKLQYDLYGNRSSFCVDENENFIKKHKKSTHNHKKDMLTDSQRIDMSRPQNFNPGPGTYFIDIDISKKSPQHKTNKEFDFSKTSFQSLRNSEVRSKSKSKYIHQNSLVGKNEKKIQLFTKSIRQNQSQMVQLQ